MAAISCFVGGRLVTTLGFEAFQFGCIFLAARAGPPRTERTSISGLSLGGTAGNARISRRFFFFWSKARASGANSGAMITSLKISLIAFATGRSSGRLQMMMPPNGACLSVANAFNHASRKSGSLPTPQGLVCFRIATVGSKNSSIRSGRRGDVQEVVKRKFFAVKFFELVGKSPVKRRALGADFRRSATADERQGKRKRGVGFLFLIQKIAIARS
jgi:hypothetical protein